MKDNSKCIILTPTLDRPERVTEDRLRELHRMGYHVHIAYGCPWVDLVRSEIASMAIREGFEELFWIDHDIVFDIEGFEKIRSHNLPVVSGIYPKKQIGPDLPFGMSPGHHIVVLGKGGNLIEARYVPTGFLYTQHQVYEDIKKTFNLPDCVSQGRGEITPYFLPSIKLYDDGTYAYLGEDASFCERARQSGYKIYIDPTVRLGHIGKYEYSWEEIRDKKQIVDSVTIHVHQRF